MARRRIISPMRACPAASGAKESATSTTPSGALADLSSVEGERPARQKLAFGSERFGLHQRRGHACIAVVPQNAGNLDGGAAGGHRETVRDLLDPEPVRVCFDSDHRIGACRLRPQGDDVVAVGVGDEACCGDNADPYRPAERPQRCHAILFTRLGASARFANGALKLFGLYAQRGEEFVVEQAFSNRLQILDPRQRRGAATFGAEAPAESAFRIRILSIDIFEIGVDDHRLCRVRRIVARWIDKAQPLVTQAAVIATVAIFTAAGSIIAIARIPGRLLRRFFRRPCEQAVVLIVFRFRNAGRGAA